MSEGRSSRKETSESTKVVVVRICELSVRPPPPIRSFVHARCGISLSAPTADSLVHARAVWDLSERPYRRFARSCARGGDSRASTP